MIIRVTVKPSSNKNILEKISDGEYKAEVKAVPERNKANNSLINLLAKEFNTPVNKIRIKNLTSRKKIIEILK